METRVDHLTQRLDTIAALLRAGDVPRGAEELAEVAREVERLPPGQERSWAHARADVERVRLHWLGVGAGTAYTLRGALEAALKTHAELGSFAPPELQAEIASIIAGIADDLGDGESLERARSVLDEAVRWLLRADATKEPARLLDEEAALELRMGHIARARELLDYARRTFLVEFAQMPTEATCAELAATHHLIARLALRPNTDDSLDLALEHARTAASEYRRLERWRDVGRVTETIARLEAARGNEDEAGAMFVVALKLADSTVDLVGLARSTAGLAELFARRGDAEEALGLLVSAIEIDRQKGSPGGLAFDESVLGELERAGADHPSLRLAIANARKRLVAAIEELA